jgi:hypothetical protein
MSAVRIRVGDYWLTGQPDAPHSLVSPAASLDFGARHQMEPFAGDQWPAQRFRDLLQKGAIVRFSVTRSFPNVTAKANWIASTLSLTPLHPWQADTFVRWQHEDGIGYTESLIDWATIRLNSIVEDGPTTVLLQYMLLGPELEDYALLAVPPIRTEAGEMWLTEEGLPILAEEHELTLA